MAEALEVAIQANEWVGDIQADERSDWRRTCTILSVDLASLGLGLARLRMMAPQTDSVTALTSDLSRELQEVHAQIRTLSYLLHPPWSEKSSGLELAIREFVEGFARRAGLKADVRIEGPPCEMDGPRQLVLFRILQEALVNVHRHAHATTQVVEFNNRAVGRRRSRCATTDAGSPPAMRPLSARASAFSACVQGLSVSG